MNHYIYYQGKDLSNMEGTIIDTTSYLVVRFFTDGSYIEIPMLRYEVRKSKEQEEDL